ncbi:MAG: ATP-binding cassette domain-containing protein [Trueperaceae bacterium]
MSSSSSSSSASANGAPVIEVRDLVKVYGDVRAVDGVTFEVRRGEFFGMLGPNGAGKSTTMRMIYQVTPPTSGALRVFGLDSGRQEKAIKQRLGVVPQMDNLDEDLRVLDNLLIYARFNGIRGPEAARRADELLTFAELQEKRKARVLQLSGGMKRRLTLARGLLNDPEAVVLDEPTTGLDPHVRLNLWNKLDELRSKGITLVMSTHYMDEAERLCDRLVIMDHGRIIAQGEPRALIREHLPPFVVEARGGTEALAGPHVDTGDPSTATYRPAAASGIGGAVDAEATYAGAYVRVAARFDAELVRSGERFSIFVRDPEAVMAELRNQGVRLERAFVRPANLEDVFLKLTGRTLRE